MQAISKNKKATIQKAAVKTRSKSTAYFNWKYIVPCVVITFLVFIYSVVHNGITNWDDNRYVTDNMLVRSWDFISLFTTRLVSNWAPAHFLLLMVQYHLFESNPLGYHITSLLLHLCNVVITFLVILKITGKRLPAFIVALFFGIHPMHVVTVAWISDQKDLLYYFFYLASILMYCYYKEHREIPWFKNKYIILSLVFFILSCLSKAMGVTLPIALVLIDSYQENNWNWKFVLRNLVKKIPFLVVSIEFGVIAYFAQKNGGALAVLNYTHMEQVMFACFGLLMYIEKFFAPFSLSAFYSYPLKNDAGVYPLIYYISPVILFALIAFLIGIVIWRNKRKQSNNALIFGVLFFLANIILVLQLKPVGRAILAERYTYLSYFGLLFILATALSNIWDKYYNKSQTWMIAVYYSVVLVFGLSSISEANVWKNSLTLWDRVINSFPEDEAMEYAAEAHNNRADAFINLHEYNLALADCNKAISLKPDFFLAYSNRANIYLNMNRYDLAIDDCNKAIEIKPDFTLAYDNRAYGYNKQQKYDLAISDCSKAISINPDLPISYNNRASAYLNERKTDSAIADCNKAIALKPDYYDAYNNRGVAYAEEGNLDLAIADYSELINLDSKFVKAYLNRSIAYRQKGEQTQAQMDIERARSLGWREGK